MKENDLQLESPPCILARSRQTMPHLPSFAKKNLDHSWSNRTCFALKNDPWVLIPTEAMLFPRVTLRNHIWADFQPSHQPPFQTRGWTNETLKFLGATIRTSPSSSFLVVRSMENDPVKEDNTPSQGSNESPLVQSTRIYDFRSWLLARNRQKENNNTAGQKSLYARGNLRSSTCHGWLQGWKQSPRVWFLRYESTHSGRNWQASFLVGFSSFSIQFHRFSSTKWMTIDEKVWTVWKAWNCGWSMKARMKHDIMDETWYHGWNWMKKYEIMDETGCMDGWKKKS